MTEAYKSACLIWGNPAIVEGLAVFCFFRQMGYPADGVFAQVGVEGDPARLAVTLRVAGDEYTLCVGDLSNGDQRHFETVWAAVADWWNTLPQEKACEVLSGSRFQDKRVAVLTDMAARGFPIPNNR